MTIQLHQEGQRGVRFYMQTATRWARCAFHILTIVVLLPVVIGIEFMMIGLTVFPIIAFAKGEPWGPGEVHPLAVSAIAAFFLVTVNVEAFRDVISKRSRDAR